MPFYMPDGRLHYYAHVPKCAGISVEAHLERRFGALGFRDDDHNRRWPERARWSRSSPQHILWDDLVRLVPEDWIASVFTVVRHPVSRLVSAFNFQATKMRIIPPGLTIDDWFEDYLSLRESYPFDHDNHLVPQSAFAPASAAFFRLEDGLAAVSAWLDERFGADGGEGIGHMNESAPDEARFFEEKGVSAALAARVAEVYAEDFERYGYAPAPAKAPLVRRPVSAPGAFRLKRRRAQKRLRHRFRSLLS
ncbi:MAG: sulfotransferase family 2 domain-containing protein [Pseudomonadota bacterium]